MDLSWAITGVLIATIALIVVAEIRCGRRNVMFHRKIDPEIRALQESVMTRYREKFGRDPTGVTKAIQTPEHRNGAYVKKA